MTLQEDAARFVAARAELLAALDEALGLSRFTRWINKKLERLTTPGH